MPSDENEERRPNPGGDPLSHLTDDDEGEDTSFAAAAAGVIGNTEQMVAGLREQNPNITDNEIEDVLRTVSSIADNLFERLDDGHPLAYDARHIKNEKKRRRATKAEMAQRRELLYELTRVNQPCSVRNIYYRAVVAGVPGITKTDSGYNKVQRLIADMRRERELPFEWITDNTRWMRKPDTWGSVTAALAATASTYRRALWDRIPVRVEVWCESDSIAGVLHPITDQWDVPLLPCRGFSSISFTQSAAATANDAGRELHVLYVGDHDPHGLDIEATLRRDLAEWLEVPHEFERVGVTWEQVEEFDLPGTKPKRTNRYPYPLAVEAEALPAPWLRNELNRILGLYHNSHELEVLDEVEAQERKVLFQLVGLAPSLVDEADR